MKRPLLIGGAIAAVVVVVAIVALVMRDDDGDVSSATASASRASAADPTLTTSTSAPADASTPAPTETTPAEVLAPPGFTKVTQAFDHGEVTVFVPASWTDVQKVQLGNGEPRLNIAPDVGKFLDHTFTTPGLRIDAFASANNNGLDTSHPKDTLDLTVSGAEDPEGPGGPLTDVCTQAGAGAFPKDLGVPNAYSGNFARFTACRGAGSALVIVAGPPDGSYLVVMQVNTTTPAEEAALPIIASSLNVRNLP